MTLNRKFGILNHRWDSESFKLVRQVNGIPVVGTSGSRFVQNPSVFLEMRGFAPCTDHERTSLP